MSSNSGRDIGDYITGNSTDEDGSLFLPSPEGHTDPWALFFSGILIGLAGGGARNGRALARRRSHHDRLFFDRPLPQGQFQPSRQRSLLWLHHFRYSRRRAHRWRDRRAQDNLALHRGGGEPASCLPKRCPHPVGARHPQIRPYPDMAAQTPASRADGLALSAFDGIKSGL